MNEINSTNKVVVNENLANNLQLPKHLIPFFIFLVKSEEDLVFFKEKNNFMSQFHSLIALRDEKIKQNYITLNRFIEEFSQNKVQALENLFVEPIEEYDIKLLENSDITITELYYKHAKNKNKRFLSYFL